MSDPSSDTLRYRRRVCDDRLYSHFITFSCYKRRRLLESEHAKRILLGQLNAALKRYSATCVGFVIMPDHAHTIVWFDKPGQLSRFMQQWKRRSRFEIRKYYRNHNAAYVRCFPDEGRFWQPKYYSFSIDNHAKLEEKLNYMHLNPVRAGLVTRPSDYQWSSARYYDSHRSVGVPIGWPD